MKLILIYIFLLLFVTSVKSDLMTPKPVEFRIYGGQFASDGQFPFMAYISYGSRRYCGASIIHQRWALTAAHCIRPRDNPSLTVGKVDDFHNGTTFKIEEFYIHGDYTLIPEEINGGLEYVINDIAVVRLDSNIQFNDTVKPVELSTDTGNYYENVTAIVMGWGKSMHNGPPNFDLHYVEVCVLPMKECRKIWKYANTHLCTSNKTIRRSQGVCYGDSGSPLVFGNLQIGVVSTTDKYCQSLKPDLHTKVADYVPWIKKVLKKHGDSLSNTSTLHINKSEILNDLQRNFLFNINGI